MFGAAMLLLTAIATEVAATAALPKTQGFRDPLWTIVVLGGYAFSIWLLTIVVRVMPVSTAYAVWSGLGTAAIALVGMLWLGESWDGIKIAALVMVVLGVAVLNLHAAH